MINHKSIYNLKLSHESGILQSLWKLSQYALKTQKKLDNIAYTQATAEYDAEVATLRRLGVEMNCNTILCSLSRTIAAAVT